uniref:DNA-directed RNA polymerase n=1 Tax=Tanacetum cinerariifolium TaxID=118510 RepID=A0A6L2JQ14_TANCI|nr:RNA polymerase beta subunit, chloroplastic [Tanacetum cinerariifolium]
MSTIPGFNQIQFEGFCRFIDQGLTEELSKFPKIEDTNQEIDFELFLERYQLVEPLIKERDAVYESLTYSSELYVSARLIWKNDRRRYIQEQTILIGKIHLMTSLGAFIVNGIYRIVINQILQSLATIKALIVQGVATAWAEYEANRSSGNGDDSHDSRSGRRKDHDTYESTYSDFLKCQPLNFNGTEGIIGLTQWNALTWLNSHVKTVGHDTAYGMSWKSLKKITTDKYCLRSEIKKLKIKIWNLKVKGTNVVSYTTRFQELALMCGRMFPEESDEVEKQAENKRKHENNNQAQQQSPKKQNVARSYSVRYSEKKEYAGTLPPCNKCKFHHNGPCTVKSDCMELKNQNHENQARGTEVRRMVYALGGGETNQDLNNLEDDIDA